MYSLDSDFETARSGFINYGQVVQLVSESSGLSLPPTIIHKCELTSAKIDCQEPVSQLHRVALEFIRPSISIGASSRYFLENDHGKVAIYEAKVGENETVSLPDGCHWTILRNRFQK
ncbi:Oidioi.mRNA.OKI2018_I69.chr2.g5327.t1.cds [Oikopleura dioica]|uniref:Oidioi.mRNA.OKI2018_I69.chr2.g5327.t1.cds n=1 Tax=Oikopleura dioica TaxID=34765 RepID=A0ABN7SZK0_OIKDI|nr:Oidioi.mRNA.OKI2018_I69.chr2.g5327.t1.cds [Oikopleura dioica]